MTDTTHAFPAHFHETFCISLIHKGVFTENGLLASKGSILVSNPGEVHENPVLPDIAYSMQTLYVPTDVISFLGGLELTYFRNNIIYDSDLFGQLEGIAAHFFQKKGSYSHTEEISKAIGTLARKHAIHATDATVTPPHWLPVVRQYIEQHLQDKLELEHLASMAGLGKFKFIRAFAQHIGLTPFEYVMLKRVQVSQQAIRAGIPLVYAGLEAGFYDQSSFTRYFKKYIGTTPGIYQAGCNIVQDNG